MNCWETRITCFISAVKNNTVLHLLPAVKFSSYSISLPKGDVEVTMNKAIVYIHGKNGSSSEADHYRNMFPYDSVIGFDYRSVTPWEAVGEFRCFFDQLSLDFPSSVIIANSIGAYYSMISLNVSKIEHAFFISPIVDMEKLILNMMDWAGVSEDDLKEKGVIATDFGETLSWDYLSYVRNHPISWNVKTDILYGSLDNLTSIELINGFIRNHHASLTVMDGGEHWFHTDEQMRFLDEWLIKNYDIIV